MSARCAAALLVLAFSAHAEAADYYVSTTGSDQNPGTQASPFKTIGRGDSVAQPGDTVHVLPGSYTGQIITSKSGTAAAHIRFVSDSKWGAQLVSGAWDVRGSYVDVIGFEVNGTNAPVGENTGFYVTGSYSTVQGNHVYNVETDIACDGHGAGGIVIDSYYGGSNSAAIGNLVHDVGPGGPGGCVYDHGVYLSQPYSSAINNVVYNISGFGVHGWHDDNHLTIVNNTLIQNGGGVLVGGGDYYMTTGPSDYNVVANNIVANNLTGMNWSGQHGTHDIYTNNLFFGNTNNVTGTGLSFSMLANTVQADPRFVGNGDYHLLSTSPAIAAADVAYSWRADFDGIARPQGTEYDIGAYEYVDSIGPVPTANLSASSGALPVLLTWNSSNADACVGTKFNTNGLVAGTTTVSPILTTTYTVTCSRQSLSASASVTVPGKRHRKKEAEVAGANGE